WSRESGVQCQKQNFFSAFDSRLQTLDSRLIYQSCLFENLFNLSSCLFARVLKRRAHVPTRVPKHIKSSLQSANAITPKHAARQPRQPLLQHTRTLMLSSLKRLIDFNRQTRRDTPDSQDTAPCSNAQRRIQRRPIP